MSLSYCFIVVSSINWCRIAANSKVKVKCAQAFTSYLKANKSEEKRENSNELPHRHNLEYRPERLKWEKSIYNLWNMDIFLTKTHRFATRGLYSPPRSHVRHVLLWMRVLYLTNFGLLKEKKKHPPTTILTLGRARKMFYITQIGFVWKKKVIYT